jgi:predicted adenine nucleotide alpha hydrolase (AANH) superfamily ATPase
MQTKKILMHICCAPCAVFPIKYLKANHPEYAVYGYFYNPNIHPYQEFARRLETLKNFSPIADFELITNESYGLEYFLDEVINDKENRCNICYEMRLKSTAALAKKEGFDAFTTTLLISPYQNHERIIETAEKIAQEEKIKFCYFDFRAGWQEGVDISRELKMYRQPYCGCIFSEMERFCKT